MDKRSITEEANVVLEADSLISSEPVGDGDLASATKERKDSIRKALEVDGPISASEYSNECGIV